MKALKKQLWVNSLYFTFFEHLGTRAYLERDWKDKKGEWWLRGGDSRQFPNDSSSNPNQMKNENTAPLSAKEEVFKDEMRGETIDDVLCVLTAAAKICLDSNQTQAALVYAEKAAELCKVQKSTSGGLV